MLLSLSLCSSSWLLTISYWRSKLGDPCSFLWVMPVLLQMLFLMHQCVHETAYSNPDIKE